MNDCPLTVNSLPSSGGRAPTILRELVELEFKAPAFMPAISSLVNSSLRFPSFRKESYLII